MKINYYEILGVERSASEQEIRDRFRKLARESHPDRYKGDDKAEIDAKMNALSEATTPLAQKMYAEQPQPGAQAQGAEEAKDAADDVVDAEFEEVKENK